MKYSLSFLYSLILKEGYIISNVRPTGRGFELTVSHKTKDATWVIVLEPGREDKIRNVLYQLSYVPQTTAEYINIGPIVIKDFHIDEIIKKCQ